MANSMADAECAALRKLTACSIEERGSSSTQKAPASATVVPPLRVEYRVALDGEIYTDPNCVSTCVCRDRVYPALRHAVTEREYEQAQRLAMRQKRRLIGSRPVKKAIKCINTTERLFAGSLPALFAGRVHSVVLIFGSSVVSPREVYVLDFVQQVDHSAALDVQVASPALSKEKTARLCTQKLVRTLIAVSTQRITSLEIFVARLTRTNSGIAVTSLHVVVLAEKRSTPIPGFVPKQSFRLRLPRASKQGNRTHHIILSGNNTPPTIPSLTGNGQQDAQKGSESSVVPEMAEPWFRHKTVVLDQDLIWYAFDKPIAGFTGVV
ncbi:hypothetical protein FI667_g2946, partial [Globisporangium splendens]